jgi:hypothetical protein
MQRYFIIRLVTYTGFIRVLAPCSSELRTCESSLMSINTIPNSPVADAIEHPLGRVAILHDDVIKHLKWKRDIFARSFKA